mmetsp:Transcript_16776/g.46167  ORF Transcript_16776/g.46167 Transcript_16776/m.46167 type:complete len:370 (+) Transcript_16776:538-1647(+)
MPKSTTLTERPSMPMATFSCFKSRCATPWPWQYAMAFATCWKNGWANAKERPETPKCCCSLKRLHGPPNSRRRTRCRFVCATPRHDAMFGWLRRFKHEISLAIASTSSYVFSVSLATAFRALVVSLVSSTAKNTVAVMPEPSSPTTECRRPIRPPTAGSSRSAHTGGRFPKIFVTLPQNMSRVSSLLCSCSSSATWAFSASSCVRASRAMDLRSVAQASHKSTASSRQSPGLGSQKTPSAPSRRRALVSWTNAARVRVSFLSSFRISKAIVGRGLLLRVSRCTKLFVAMTPKSSIATTIAVAPSFTVTAPEGISPSCRTSTPRSRKSSKRCCLLSGTPDGFGPNPPLSSDTSEAASSCSVAPGLMSDER